MSHRSGGRSEGAADLAEVGCVGNGDTLVLADGSEFTVTRLTLVLDDGAWVCQAEGHWRGDVGLEREGVCEDVTSLVREAVGIVVGDSV